MVKRLLPYLMPWTYNTHIHVAEVVVLAFHSFKPKHQPMARNLCIVAIFMQHVFYLSSSFAGEST